VLVDSSVWISFIRGDDLPQTRHLLAALKSHQPVWTAPPVIREVLQGSQNQQVFAKWDRILSDLPMVFDRDQRGLARDAAQLYATCRWNGVSPRSSVDCLISLYAVRANLPLLHADRDFTAISRYLPALKILAPAS
jgi:predicted nucleic acid-binding protein